MRPIIGITTDFEVDTTCVPPRPRISLVAAYSDAILAAGGLPQPLPIPPEPHESVLDALLGRVDGLLFTGGPDLDPQQYGQTPHTQTHTMHPRREAFELALFRRADARRVPILSVCLGFQVTHVARGGQLVQHVDDLKLSPPLVHHLPKGQSAFHAARIEPGSRLATVVGGTEIEVNSRHHQAADVQHPGRDLRSVAFAPDGMLEASEDMNGRFLLAVQWHPENLIDRNEHLRLFQALVETASARSR